MKKINLLKVLAFIIPLASILTLLLLATVYYTPGETSIYLIWLMTILGLIPFASQLFFWVNLSLKRKNRMKLIVLCLEYIGSCIYTAGTFLLIVKMLSFSQGIPNYIPILCDIVGFTNLLSAYLFWLIHKKFNTLY